MLKINLNLFGGRGGATSSKYTTKQLGGMTRAQLLPVARRIFVRQNMAAGLSRKEATRRFSLLEDGNTTPQLRKYIKKYQ